MRISDWSSDVCSSDLAWNGSGRLPEYSADPHRLYPAVGTAASLCTDQAAAGPPVDCLRHDFWLDHALHVLAGRSEEHTSELQSLMRISYAVFCLKKKNNISYQLCI